MKKQEKQYEENTEDKQKEYQSIHTNSNSENMQPVPQPKDFEEIEY